MPNYLRIAEIAVCELRGIVSSKQRLELEELLGNSQANRDLFRDLTDRNWLKREQEIFNGGDEEKAWNRLQQRKEKIKEETQAEIVEMEIPTQPVRHRRISWKLVAAILVLAAGTAIWYFLIDRVEKIVKTPAANNSLIDSTSPDNNTANLILSNGNRIKLDTVKPGAVATLAEAEVIKNDSSLIYKPSKEDSSSASFNTLTTGPTEQYRLVLADSSVIFLRASSSIHFPTAFNGPQRRVEVTGDVSFEVAKNAAKPFFATIVSETTKRKRAEIEVVGTRFNVSAYDKNPGIQATLLEGSIKLAVGDSVKVLKPGEQARISQSGKIEIILIKDTANYRNSIIVLDQDLRTIMNKIEQLYDVQVQYDGKPNMNEYSFAILRTTTLQKLIEILDVRKIQVTMKGRTLIVKQLPE